MKKIILLYIIISSSIFVAYSQQVPEFQFTLYAEDFFGNKDSVVIGYDFSASLYDTIDTQFGEIDITSTPFDSIFEMRVSPFNDPPLGLPHGRLQSKKEICKWSCADIPILQYAFTPVYISIRSKSLPIRISWDVNTFQDTCVDAFVFSEFYQWGLLWDWMAGVHHHYLRDGGYNIVYNNIHPTAPNNIYQAPIEGGGTGNVYGLTLFVGSEDVIGWVSTQNIQHHLVAQVAPNPVLETVQFEIPAEFKDMERISIYNINGQLVHQENISQYQFSINANSWTNGLYLYTIENKKGEVIRGKLVKSN